MTQFTKLKEDWKRKSQRATKDSWGFHSWLLWTWLLLTIITHGQTNATAKNNCFTCVQIFYLFYLPVFLLLALGNSESESPWHSSRASTWMSEWPVSITFDLSETQVLPPEHCVVPLCSPIRVWIDYLLFKTRHDRAGHQRESKTKSQISQTLYQSNILEAQSRYLQESHRLQRETCEGFFLTSELRIVADQRLCLSFVTTWHNRRLLLRPMVLNETNTTVCGKLILCLPFLQSNT